jgi:hypothetical protein
MYQKIYPDLIRINRNETNLGIVDNFNRSMSLLKHKGYVCFLGADNRFRSTYLELCAGALDKNPNAVIAYTDFALFGDRAGKVYEGFDPRKHGEVINNSVYMINFHTFDPSASNRDEELRKSYTANIHGSSMYRRSAFDAIGGYKKTNEAEDMNLFTRMLTQIPNAIPAHIPIPVLEYRQHSELQANIVLGEVIALRQQNTILKQLLAKVVSSKKQFISVLGYLNKRIYIWGAGKYTQDMIDTELSNIKIHGFIETSPTKNIFYNLPIFSAKVFFDSQKLDDVFIIICTPKYSEEIKKSCLEFNLIEGRDFCEF